MKSIKMLGTLKLKDLNDYINKFPNIENTKEQGHISLLGYGNR